MSNAGKFASALAALAVAFVFAVFAFVWFFCRIYVGPGEMAIVTSKTGDELPPGAILAEPGQKGVQRMPLAEGRHFLNPITHDWRIVRATTIPAGSVGIVTSKNGQAIKDICKIASKRDPYIQLVLYHVNVQGRNAVPSRRGTGSDPAGQRYAGAVLFPAWLRTPGNIPD